MGANERRTLRKPFLDLVIMSPPKVPWETTHPTESREKTNDINEKKHKRFSESFHFITHVFVFFCLAGFCG
jgi:hypothetical protein